MILGAWPGWLSGNREIRYVSGGYSGGEAGIGGGQVGVVCHSADYLYPICKRCPWGLGFNASERDGKRKRIETISWLAC